MMRENREASNETEDASTAAEGQTGRRGGRRFAAAGLVIAWLILFLPFLGVLVEVFAIVLGEQLVVLIEDHVPLDRLDLAAIAVMLSVFLVGGHLLVGLVLKGRIWVRTALAILIMTIVVFVLCIGTAKDTWGAPQLQSTGIFALWFQVTLCSLLLAVSLAAGFTWALWRGAVRSPLVAGAIGGLGMIGSPLMLVAISAFGVAMVNSSLHDELDLEPSDIFMPTGTTWVEEGREYLEFLSEEGRERSRARRKATEAGLVAGDALDWTARAYGASFDGVPTCLRRLQERKEGECDGKIDQAARAIKRNCKFLFDDARDVAVDKAIDVCVRLNRPGAAPVADLYGYYFTSASNACKDLKRTARRTCELRDADAIETSLFEDESFRRKSCLNNVLCSLEPKQRSLFELCVEFPVREIAQRTGVSKSKAQRDCAKIEEEIVVIAKRTCD